MEIIIPVNKKRLQIGFQWIYKEMEYAPCYF